MKHKTVSEDVEKSISYGIDTGKIDPERDAASLGMLRYMADALDDDGGSTSVLRYVTPASFLSYCKEFGFMPEIEKREKRIDKNSKLHVVGNSKWKKNA